MHKQNREIEVRFLRINKEVLINKLLELKAQDNGEVLLRELIFYDPELTWSDEGKMVRLRDTSKKITMSYKHHTGDSIMGAEEIELEVNSLDNAKKFLERIGLLASREQEKKRHTFILNHVIIDIDTWPTMPPYVEIEGESEEDVKMISEKLGYKWGDAIFENAKIVIEKYYNIPVSKLRFFTFDKVE